MGQGAETAMSFSVGKILKDCGFVDDDDGDGVDGSYILRFPENDPDPGLGSCIIKAEALAIPGPGFSPDFSVDFVAELEDRVLGKSWKILYDGIDFRFSMHDDNEKIIRRFLEAVAACRKKLGI